MGNITKKASKVEPTPLTAEEQRAIADKSKKDRAAKLERMRENNKIEIEETLLKIERDRRRAEEAPARKKREEKKVADANIGVNMRNTGNPISLVRPHKSPVKKMKVAPVGLDIFVDK